MIEHIEAFLGKIDSGWGAKDSDLGIQIVRFKDQPFNNINTFATIGLSNTKLLLNDKKEVRQEILVSIYENFDSNKIASSLLSFAEHISESKKGLLKGEVIGPGAPFINEVKTVGLYASIPVFFEEEFYIYNKTKPPIVFVWLIPLIGNEINYIKKKGWEKFEDILEKSNCDFWNLNRNPCISSSTSLF